VRRLLKVRDARVYLTGQVFSLFGDTALWLAMGIWVKTLTGSNAAAGLVFFFANVPVLLTPLTGLLVDRVHRRPLLIAVNALTGAAVLLLLLVHGRGQVWLVYLVMTWYGLSYSVLAAAQSALLTTVLPTDLLADANGALRTVQESLRLAGPLTGAGLFVLGGGHVVAILDAATFVVPVVSLLMLRVREPAPQPRRSNWRTELTAGLRHVTRTPALRHLVIAAACALTVFGFTETIIYAVAGDGLHRPPAFVGVLIAIQGVGAVAGGPTAAPLIRRIGEGRLVGLGMLVAAAAALLEMPPFLPSVVAGVILFGVSVPWLVVGFTTLLQRLTPPDLQGRVYAAADTLVTTPQTISIAAGAALIGVTGYRPLLAALAAVVTLAAAYLLTRPEQRRAPDPAPNLNPNPAPATQAAGGSTSS
jgi:MFS family permease